jgi:hypothetical protein
MIAGNQPQLAFFGEITLPNEPNFGNRIRHEQGKLTGSVA